MRKSFGVTCLALLFCLISKGQNRPLPSYVEKQSLPDSVLSTELFQLNGESKTLKEVLSTHKGQKIFIDFWASWCIDCIVSLPKYKSLRKKTKKMNVVYLFLSVDKDDARWKYAISKFSIKAEHYRFKLGWKNPFSNYIDLDWIPRYVVINEEGQIIMGKSIKMDDEAIIEALK